MADKVTPFRKRQTLSLVMVVKDAEAFIGRSISSATAIVDEIVIVDTGSTDRTKEIAASFSDRVSGVGGAPGVKVVDFEMRDDYSAARNAGIEAADCDWILTLHDYEEIIKRPEDIRPLLNDERYVAYLVQRVTGESTEALPTDSSPEYRIFRRTPELRFRNRIFEQLTLDDPGRATMSAVAILHFAPGLDDEPDPVHIALLDRALGEDHSNGYLWSRLGDEYFPGDPASAYEAYYQAMTLADPNDLWAPPMLRNMAWCLYNLGHKDSALSLLHDLQMKYSPYTDVFFVEGDIALNEGDYQRAAYLFKKCLDMGDPPPVFGSWGGTGTWRAYSAMRDAQAKQRGDAPGREPETDRDSSAVPDQSEEDK